MSASAAAAGAAGAAPHLTVAAGSVDGALARAVASSVSQAAPAGSAARAVTVSEVPAAADAPAVAFWRGGAGAAKAADAKPDASGAAASLVAAFGSSAEQLPAGARVGEVAKQVEFALGSLRSAVDGLTAAAAAEGGGDTEGPKRACLSLLHRLNKALLLDNFVAGGVAASVADLVVYAVVRGAGEPLRAAMDPALFAPILRWMAQLTQHEEAAQLLATQMKLPAFKPLALDALGPKYVFGVSTGGGAGAGGAKGKGDGKQQGGAGAAAAGGDDLEAKRAARKAQRQAAQAKKAAAKQGAGKGGAAAPALSGFACLDLRVGVITEVKKHPDADRMYVEKIDLGEDAPREVVSGLVDFVPIEEMQGRLVVCLCNMRPAPLRGIKSFAVVLGAKVGEPGKDERLELLDAPEGAVAGDRLVELDGDGAAATAAAASGEGEAAPFPPQLNHRKKQWESLKPELKTNADATLTYAGKIIGVQGKGPVKVKSIADAPIS